MSKFGLRPHLQGLIYHWRSQYFPIFYNYLTNTLRAIARLFGPATGEHSILKYSILTTVAACLLVSPALCAETAPCADEQTCESDNKFKWGGSFRLRLEGWRNFAFLPDADDEFVLGRLLLFADTRFNDRIRLFVEGKSALSTDRDLPGGKRPIDVDTLALQQAYLDLNLVESSTDVSLQLGRQALSYGRQRLVSPLPWGNTLRTWDGALVRAGSAGKWTADAFYTWFVPVDKYDTNRRDDDQPFYGVYATYLAKPQRGIDAYWLHRELANAVFNGTEGPERRDTFGLRLYHQSGPWRADVEVALQTGRIGANDIDASMAALELKRFWEDGVVESVSAGVDYGSGDRSPGGKVETFSHLYPLGHAYLGYMDFIGRQNIIAAFLRSRFRVFDKAVVEVTGFTFSRAHRADGLYNAGGGLLRPGDASTDKDVGKELDITLARPVGDSGNLLIGYSHFFPGDFVKTSGPSASSDFAYVQYLLKF